MREKELEVQKKAEEMARKKAQENEQKKKSEEEKEDTNNNDNETNGMDINSSSVKNIIIGDSRMVCLCATLNGDWTRCQYSSGGGYDYDNVYFVAQGSMSYSWFNNTAIAAVNNILSNNTDKKVNIITNMVVNMLLYDVDNYFSKYNELLSNQWKDKNFIIVSVIPVDESKQSQSTYLVRNADIETFNNKIKNGVSKVKYCDVYSQIKNNFETADGVHYMSNTYRMIYQKILNCI